MWWKQINPNIDNLEPQAVAQTRIAANPATAPNPHSVVLSQPPKVSFGLGIKRLLLLSLLLIGFIAGIAGLSLAYGKVLQPKAAGLAGVNANYNAASIPLSDLIKAGNITVDPAGSLSVNGQLRVNGGFVLDPAIQPATATSAAGQIYYDRTDNRLRYFNGQVYVDVLGGPDKTTLGGQSGNITIGPGLNLNGNQLSSVPAVPSVLSLQGQTGAVTLTNGGGISITGTTITNTGVTMLGGQTGNVGVGNGLSAAGGTLLNTGVISFVSGSAALTVTHDGSGNYSISDIESGVGGNVALGPLAPQDDAGINPSIWINKSGSGNLLQLSTGAVPVNRFVVDNSGAIISGTIGFNQVIAKPNFINSIDTAAGDILLGTGLARSGQTISNNGVLSVGGLSGTVTLGTGLGVSAGQLVATGSGVGSVAGTPNQIIVTGSGALTLSLPQDIAASSTPTFAGLNLSAPLTVANGGTGLAVVPGNGQILIGNGAGYSANTLSAGSGVQITNAAGAITISAPSSGSCASCANTALSNLSLVALNTSLVPGAAGAVNLGSGPLPFGQLSLSGSSATPATNNFLITGTSTGGTRTITLPNASGTVAVSASGYLSLNAATGALSFVGPLTIADGGTGTTTAAGARSNLGAAASGANTDITAITGLTTALSVAQGGSGVASLNQNGVLLGNGISPISSLVAGSAGQCLVSTAGAPAFQFCPGSGGVASVNGGTGAITIDGVSAGSVATIGNAITINNASTAIKGLASFNGTNFSVVGGAVNTIQGIATSATPTFAGLNLTSALSVANGGTGSNTATGARTNLSAAASGINADITSLTAVTSIGQPSQSLALQGSDTSTLAVRAAGSSTAIGFATPTANVTYLFQSAAAGTYNVCTMAGNCVGVGGGVTSPGGTAGKLAKFSGGQTLVDSLISESGTTVTVGGILTANTLTPTAALTLGATTQSLTLQGSSVAIKVGANAINLPNAPGTVAVSAGGPLSLDASGNLTCATCLTSGGGGGTAGVASINAMTGAILVQGTPNQVVAASSGGAVTLSLPQSIDTAASPTFAAMSLANTLNVTNATTVGSLAATGSVTGSTINALALTSNATGFSIAGGTVSKTLNVLTNITLDQNLATTSSPTFGGLTLTSALAVASGGTGSATAAGARTNLGAAARGANSDITSLTGLTTAITVGEGGTGLTALPTNGQLLIGNATGYTLGNIIAGTGMSITNAAGSITAAVDATVCRNTNNCGYSVGGSSVDLQASTPGVAQTGNINVTGAIIAGGNLSAGSVTAGTINNLTLSSNATGFSITGGTTPKSLTLTGDATINQSLTTTSNPTFNGLALTTALPVTSGGTGSGTAAGARTSLGAAAAGANSDITSLTGLTTALTVAQGGTGTASLTQNGVVIGQGTVGLTSLVAGGVGQCLISTAGAPVWQNCPVSTSVSSLNGANGAVTLAGTAVASVSTVGGAITINDASSTTKGLASFGSTNFSVTAGAVNTIQGISPTSSPTFNALTLTNALSVANGGTGLNSTPVNGQILIGNGTNFSLNTLTAGAGMNITNTAGTITLSSPNSGTCTSCADQTLNNLAAVAINTSLLPGVTNTIDLGSGSFAFRNAFLTGLDTASAVPLTIGTSSATAINLNQNTVIAAGKSLTVTGGITSTRPASPTEGMLYYDTTTHGLIVYTNGKWSSYAGRTATKIVGTSAVGGVSGAIASQNTDGLDYVNTSTTSAQTVINAAIAALPATGGSIYLMEGTYIVDGQINVPNNVSINGAGAATIIKVKNATNGNFGIIANSDTSTGTKVTIQNLRIDGNKANQTLGAMYGIIFDHMGGGSGSGAREGGKIANVYVSNMYSGTRGNITFITSYNNIVTGSTVTGSNWDGVSMQISSNNNFTGNTFQGNAVSGIYDLQGNNNTITGNMSQGNLYGIVTQSSSGDTITGNTAQGNTGIGIYLFSTSNNNNTITGNTIGGSPNGIYITGANNVIGSNKIHDSGGATTNNGITIGGDANTVIGNDITDTSCTTTCYAIDIPASYVNNYLADNRHSGTAANSSSIHDLGTGTIFANQADGSGNLMNKSQGGGLTVGASSATASLSLQGGLKATALPAPTLNPTVTNTGTAGATTQLYQVTALDGLGETTGSTVQQTTTGNAVLSGVNYNTITWTPVGGAYQYRIYRCTGAACTPALLATVAGNTTSYNDQAAGAPSGAVPTLNTTGGASLAALLQGTTASFGGAGSLTVGTTGANTGSIAFKSVWGSSGSVTLQANNISTNNYTLTLPSETGTICSSASLCPGSAPATLGSGYIQNQSASVQGASYWITGAGRADGGIRAPSLDTSTAGALGIGQNFATAINLYKDTAILGVNFTATGPTAISTSPPDSFVVTGGLGKSGGFIGTGIRLTGGPGSFDGTSFGIGGDGGNITLSGGVGGGGNSVGGNGGKIILNGGTGGFGNDASGSPGTVNLQTAGGLVSIGGALNVSSVISGFQGVNVSAGKSYSINGIDINTGRTLTNVAYLDQTNTFTGGALFKATANSTTAFQIQKSDSSPLLIADTVGMKVTVQNLVVSVNLTVNGHIVSGGSAPTIAAGAAACTTPTVSIAGTDTAGLITVTTGTGCASVGKLAGVTFATAYGAAPQVTLTPALANSATLQSYIDSATIATTTFDLNTGTTPTSTTTYKWFYHVIQ